MKLPIIQTFCTILISGAVSVTYADEGKNESGKGRESGEYSYEKHRERGQDRRDGHWEDDAYGSYFHEHGYAHLDIPPGHYPPPGECRVWFPDRPAGHQPPPGNCNHVPPGAWLIRHPRDFPGHVYVNVYEPNYPGRVHVIGEFDIGSGQFIRIILDH